MELVKEADKEEMEQKYGKVGTTTPAKRKEELEQTSRNKRWKFDTVSEDWGKEMGAVPTALKLPEVEEQLHCSNINSDKRQASIKAYHVPPTTQPGLTPGLSERKVPTPPSNTPGTEEGRADWNSPTNSKDGPNARIFQEGVSRTLVPEVKPSIVPNKTTEDRGFADSSWGLKILLYRRQNPALSLEWDTWRLQLLSIEDKQDNSSILTSNTTNSTLPSSAKSIVSSTAQLTASRSEEKGKLSKSSKLEVVVNIKVPGSKAETQDLKCEQSMSVDLKCEPSMSKAAEQNVGVNRIVDRVNGNENLKVNTRCYLVNGESGVNCGVHNKPGVSRKVRTKYWTKLESGLHGNKYKTVTVTLCPVTSYRIFEDLPKSDSGGTTTTKRKR